MALNGTTQVTANAIFDPKLRAIGPGPRFTSMWPDESRDTISARENYEIFREYRDAYSGYRTQMEDDYVFSKLGRQYTASQEEALAADKQAPLIFNHCRRIAEQYVAHVVGRTPRITALPRLGATRQLAQVMADVLAYIWYGSRGTRVTGMATSEMIVRGPGFLFAFLDRNADFGRGDIRFDWLSPMITYLDPSTRDPFAETAEHAVISQLVARSRLAQLYPQHRELIQSAAIDTSDEDYQASSRGTAIGSYGYAYGDQLRQDRQQLRVIDRYTKILREMIMLLDPMSEEPIGLFPASEQRKIRAFVAEWDRLIRAAHPDSDGIEIPFRRVNVWRVRRVTSLTIAPSFGRRQSPGSAILADEVMEIDRYPIIPLFNIDTGNPFPPGEVRDLKEPQRFFNTVISKLTKQLSGLAGGGKTFVHEESDAYEEMLEKQNLPNATIRWRGEPHMMPQIMPPPPVAQGHMELAMASKSWMDGVSGMVESLQGAPGGDRESARLRAIRGEEASRRPDQKLKIVEGALEELGRVLAQMAQRFYTGPKVFSLSDTAGEMRQFAINQAGGAEGMPRHVSMSGETIYGSLNVGAYSVVIAPGSTKPTNRQEQLQEAMALSQIIAANPAAAAMILDSWDHPKAQQYAEQFATVSQMQRALEETQKKLSESERRLFVAENETKRAREQKELEQLRGDLETLMARFKAKLDTLEKGVAITAGQARAELQAARKVAVSEAKAAARQEKTDGKEE